MVELIDAQLYEETVEIRRTIHQYPEIGFEVHKTAALVAEKLKNLGLEVYTGIGKTGVMADLKVEGATHCIGLRADMDALPMQELGEKPYKSKIDGAAHMCGHDAHTAMLLGAASWLVKNKHLLKNNVRFIFQPNEERLPGGAPAMIEDGVLDGVDEIYAQHVWPSMDVGTFGVCRGAAMGQPDEFAINITGKGGHAAFPHTVADPIVLASQFIQAAQTIVSRNLSPLQSGVVSFTSIHAGQVYNVIPETVEIKGTIRTLNSDVKEYMQRRLETILKSLCEAHDSSYELIYRDGYPVTFNHPEATERAVGILNDQFGKSTVVYPHEPVLGGEDFGYYSQKIPGCFVFLGCRNEAQGIIHALHHPRFDIDEACLRYGIRVLTQLAMK